MTEAWTNFDITGNGFLPINNCTTLPKGWSHLQELLEMIDSEDSQKFQEVVKKTLHPPDISLKDLTLAEKRYLYTLFCTLQARYVWSTGQKTPNTVIHSNIAKPLVQLSEDLDMPPYFNYFAAVAWNWQKSSDSQTISVQNLKTIFNYSSSLKRDIMNFSVLHVCIEYAAGKCFYDMLEAKNYMKDNNKEEISKCLHKVSQCLEQMSQIFGQFPAHVSIEGFYNFRHIYDGICNKSLFPNGLEYEGTTLKGITYPTVNAGQSPMIQTFDTFLEVTLEKENQEFENRNSKCFTKPHLAFIKELGKGPHLKAWIQKSSNQELTQLYNQCITKLAQFRHAHFKIVQHYIFDVMDKRKIPRNQLAIGERHPSILLKSLLEDTKNAKIFSKEYSIVYIIIVIFIFCQLLKYTVW